MQNIKIKLCWEDVKIGLFITIMEDVEHKTSLLNSWGLAINVEKTLQ
jgi:hypothetical protein